MLIYVEWSESMPAILFSVRLTTGVNHNAIKPLGWLVWTFLTKKQFTNKWLSRCLLLANLIKIIPNRWCLKQCLLSLAVFIWLTQQASMHTLFSQLIIGSRADRADCHKWLGQIWRRQEPRGEQLVEPCQGRTSCQLTGTWDLTWTAQVETHVHE